MSDIPSTTSGIWVRKRDGASEPFQKSKLVSLLHAAMAAVGEGSGTLAVEMADAISAHVASQREGAVLRTRQIADLVQRALDETGLPDTAVRIRDTGRHRDYLRRQVRVLAWKASLGKQVPRRWNKSVLVQRLMRQHDLDAPVARLVAGRVEDIVLSLGLHVVTGGLVAELAASELLAWGLAPIAAPARAGRAVARE